MTTSLAEKIRVVLKKTLPATGPLVVGVSGGADSIALLSLLVQSDLKLRPRLQMVHVHHGLRSRAADADKRLVQAYSRRWQVPCFFYQADVRQSAAQLGLSLETTGRLIRQDCFLDAARVRRAHAVLLAHHQGDLAETVLLNLLRGAGSQGLASLRTVRPFPHPAAPPELKVIRPLLACAKSELIEYLRTEQLAWREDQSNQSTEFTRNRIRLELLPWLTRHINPQAEACLARSAQILAREDEYLERALPLKNQRLVSRKTLRQLEIHRMKFLRQVPTYQYRLVAHWWEELGIPQKSTQHLEEILRAAQQGHLGVSLPGGWRFFAQALVMGFVLPACPPQEKNYQRALKIGINQNQKLPVGVQLEIQKPPARIKPPTHQPAWVVVDADKITGALRLENFKPGDVLQPLGMAGKRKAVKKILAELKVPMAQRAQWPVIWDQEKIVWVFQGPLSELYKVDQQTRRILKISIWENPKKPLKSERFLHENSSHSGSAGIIRCKNRKKL